MFLILGYCISVSTATYQRIKPVAPPSGKGQDSSSSYSVTLFIGDRETPSVTATASSDSVRRESSGLPMRSYMSLPRPPNKSVFRKFFGKKEWRTLMFPWLTCAGHKFQTLFLHLFMDLMENHLCILSEWDLVWLCCCKMCDVSLHQSFWYPAHGWCSQKWKSCHHLLTLMLFQTHMTLSFMEHRAFSCTFIQSTLQRGTKEMISLSQYS